MAKRKRSRVNAKGRNTNTDRFVALRHRLLASEAYRSLSLAARCLWVELAMIENGSNNGSLYLSVRDAADRLGMSDLTSTSRAFDELIDRGFIRCTKEAHFEVKAAETSRARCWRLTYLAADNRPPANDWESYTAPAHTTARKRADKGMKVLKRFRKQLTSDRLPVLETRTKVLPNGPSAEFPVLETSTDQAQRHAKQPNLVVLDSNAHAAVTITRPRSEWWRHRSFLRLPDPYVFRAGNDP